MRTAIWWIRRDLRLDDNQALHAALEQADSIIPLFIIDSNLWQSSYVGPRRLTFLLAALRSLDVQLQKRGSRLIVRHGQPLNVLKKLMTESEAIGIFAQDDGSPYARQRDAQIQAELPLKLTRGLSIQSLGLVRKADGSPYIVFTPYSKIWKSLPQPTRKLLLAAPEQIDTPANIDSQTLPDEPTLSEDNRFPPNEAEALRRLDAFVNEEIYQYKHVRDRMDVAGTSQLSPYLRFGLLSPRRAGVAAWTALKEAQESGHKKNAETWLNELIWREFYLDILHHYPRARQGNFRPEYDLIEWRNDEAEFSAWCAGRTGYPVVDAAMRQLRQSGWMHNRARMIVASFLVKDLLIDWRWGERWFMQHLLDGDPASNNGGWQWTAGTGTDSAPYFRIFNPTSQSKKFDPAGEFIKRWVPELANLPEQFIHEPWQMSVAYQQHFGCVLDVDYPAPIVDHKMARQRTLDAYKEAREAS